MLKVLEGPGRSWNANDLLISYSDWLQLIVSLEGDPNCPPLEDRNWSGCWRTTHEPSSLEPAINGAPVSLSTSVPIYSKACFISLWTERDKKDATKPSSWTETCSCPDGRDKSFLGTSFKVKSIRTQIWCLRLWSCCCCVWIYVSLYV